MYLVDFRFKIDIIAFSLYSFELYVIIAFCYIARLFAPFNL